MYKNVAIPSSISTVFPTDYDRSTLAQLCGTGWLVAASPSAEITPPGLVDKGYRAFSIGYPETKPYVNFYVLQQIKDERLLIFDAGPYLETKELTRDFAKLGLNPTHASAIFLTHGDIDHVAGAELPDFQKIPQFISINESHLIQGGKRSCMSKGPNLPERDTRQLIDTDYIYRSDEFANLSISVIPIPGHTAGSVAYRIAIGSPTDPLNVIYATGDAVRLQKNWVIGSITDQDGSRNKSKISKNLKPDVAQALRDGHTVSIWTGHTSNTSNPNRIRTVLSITEAK